MAANPLNVQKIHYFNFSVDSLPKNAKSISDSSQQLTKGYQIMPTEVETAKPVAGAVSRKGDLKGIERVRQMKADIAQEIEGLKTDTARQLAKVVEMIETIEAEGFKDFLSEPQFFEYTEKLFKWLQADTSLIQERAPVTIRTRKKKGPGGAITAEDVVKALGEEEMNQSALIKKLDTTNVTFQKRVKELGNKLSHRKEGRSVMWKKK